MLSLSILIGCIVLLVIAITYFDIHPVIALLLAGLLLGTLLGMDIDTTTNSLLSGFGNTLKWIGLIILFGTLLGEILALTGGATLIAEAIIALFGQKYLVLGVALIGFLVGIPVFVDVAYLTLLPTLIALAKKTGQSILVLGLSLALSLGVAHALIPPTPGPLAVAAMLNTEVGNIIPLNIVAAITAIFIGVAFILLFRSKLQHPVIEGNPKEETTTDCISGYKRALPFLALISPLTLMGIGSFLSDDYQVVAFIKSPLWALLIGILFTLPLLPKPNRLKQVNSQFSVAMKKSAAVILITGCGGAFGQVIKDTNIVTQLISNPSQIASLGILLALLLSFLFTTVTGSITVSLITTASIMAPLVSEGALSPEITAAAIGAGSLGIIHVNSSFFWLFKETHQLTAKKVLRSFSLATLTMALGSGLVIYFISKII